MHTEPQVRYDRRSGTRLTGVRLSVSLVAWVLVYSLTACGIGCKGFGVRHEDRFNSPSSHDDDWSIPVSKASADRMHRDAQSVQGNGPLSGQSPYANSSRSTQLALSGSEINPVSADNAPSPVVQASATEAIKTPPVAEEAPQEGAHDSLPVEPPAASKPVTVSLSDASQQATEVSAGSEASGSADEQSFMDIVDAGGDGIDLEGALAELPAPYRDLLRRQLEAAKEKESAANDSSKATDSVKASLSDRQSETDEQAATNAEAIPVVAKMPSAAQPVVQAEAMQSADDSMVQMASANIPKLDSISDLPPNPSQANSGDARNPPAGGANSEAPQGHWNHSLAQTIQLLHSQISEIPEGDDNLRFHSEIALRMLMVAARRLDEACQPIQGLSEEENLYLRHQMHALYEASNPDAMPVRSRHLSLVMNSQRQATNQLAAASNLEVRSTAFCTEVERYGVVTQFPRYAFTPDQEVLLYCEIENVAAKQIRNGFETQLQGSYEIVDSKGNLVSEQILPMEPDYCQNHRRDYFIVYKIFMPQQISPGDYKLRLTIEDMNARKFGQSTLDFQIKK